MSAIRNARPAVLLWALGGLATLTLWGGTALAVNPAKPITQYVQEFWTTDQGLPQDAVHAILQSQDGYLWIATEEGLVRFDGIRFTVFDRSGVAEILDNYILCLAESADGGLWFGTRGGGLGSVKDGVFSNLTTRNGLPSNFVYAVVAEPRGDLWIGTSGGLSRLSRGRLTSYARSDGLPGTGVYALSIAGDGSLWLGTNGGGLVHFRDGTFSAFTTTDGLASNVVRAVLVDHAGRVWAGTESGLSCLQDGKFTLYTTKNGLSGNVVYALREDNEATVWIGTYGGGLNRLRSGGRVDSLTTQDGLPSDVVEAVYEDREGSLWFGTVGGGLGRLQDGMISTLGTKDGLPTPIIWSVYQDHVGSIWMGTDGGGVSHLENGRFVNYSTKNGLSNNVVKTTLVTRRGDVWFGTDSGLNLMTRDEFRVFTTRDGLTSNSILSLLEAVDGAVWIGTRKGLCRLRYGRITEPWTEQGLADAAIRTLLVDRGGALWAGTDNGLYRFNGEQVVHFTTGDGLPGVFIYTLYEDADGVLWIGTRGGLARMVGGAFTAYTTHEGMFDNVVFNILEDDEGRFWMSCNKGIYRVDKRELTELAAGRRGSVRSVAFGKAEGMKSRECNAGGQPAGWKTSDGRLWFPTTKGVAIIDPREGRKVNRQPPPVLVEQVLVDGRAYQASPGGRLVLAAETEKLEFHYTALSFVAPQQVRFKYKLEGFDPNWIDVGTRRVAYYTKIPPGQYRFAVIGCNNDGVWNEAGASVDLYLEPHFYQTRWFVGLCILGGVLVASGGYLARARQMKARETDLVRVVEERTRELRDNQQKLLISEKMASLGHLTAGIAHEMNTPLAAVRASLSELEKLVEEYESSVGVPEITVSDHHEIGAEMHKAIHLASTASERAVSFVRSIKSQTRAAATDERRFFDPSEVIHDALLLLDHMLKKENCTATLTQKGPLQVYGSPGRFAQVVINLVTNAIEASRPKGGGAILLNLSLREDGVELQVRDQGVGIALEIQPSIFDPMFTTKPFGQGSGLGLAIVHEIVTGEFAGTVSVASRVGEGALFTVTLNNPPENADGS